MTDAHSLRMSADLRDRQLQRCCDVLTVARADAPTLCEGWTAHDLAIHLWQLKHDPLAWPGIAVPPLRRLSDHRADIVRRRWPYLELIEQLRGQFGPLPCMPLDRFTGNGHALGEYFIHTQDVARPNGLEQPAPDDALQEALWLRCIAAARVLRGKQPAGLVLEHTDGRRQLIGRATGKTIVSGLPSELLCWVSGRRSVADVTVRQE